LTNGSAAAAAAEALCATAALISWASTLPASPIERLLSSA
jgi:hypothetical protein